MWAYVAGEGEVRVSSKNQEGLFFFSQLMKPEMKISDDIIGWHASKRPMSESALESSDFYSSQETPPPLSIAITAPTHQHRWDVNASTVSRAKDLPAAPPSLCALNGHGSATFLRHPNAP